MNIQCQCAQLWHSWDWIIFAPSSNNHFYNRPLISSSNATFVFANYIEILHGCKWSFFFQTPDKVKYVHLMIRQKKVTRLSNDGQFLNSLRRRAKYTSVEFPSCVRFLVSFKALRKKISEVKGELSSKTCRDKISPLRTV